MQQVVLPIKDSNVLKEVQDTLLHNFKAGQRNYIIFQVGKATLLRVNDVMKLRWVRPSSKKMVPCIRIRLSTIKNRQCQSILFKTGSN